MIPIFSSMIALTFLPVLSLTPSTVIAQIVLLFYPIADFVLFLFSLFLLIPLLRNLWLGRHLVLLCISFFAFIVSDLLYVYFVLNNTYEGFNAFLSDSTYSIAYLLFVLTAFASFKVMKIYK